MEFFDRIIRDTATLLSPYTPRTWKYRSEAARKESPPNELVLARDSAFVLGGGNRPALTYSCATTDGSLIGSDEILLYGADLGEIRSDLPFARIVMVKIADIGDLKAEGGGEDAAYKAVKDIEFVKYKVFPEGYMIRAGALDFREQVRVSKKAQAEGISFESVGAAFIRKYKENPLVETVRVIFIAGEFPVFKELAENARKTADTAKALSHVIKTMKTDCRACNLKPICDEVEGMRELHFKAAGPSLRS
jgi:CO dehydrogenase/acetyl-CoA synthase beta subunit